MLERDKIKKIYIYLYIFNENNYFGNDSSRGSLHKSTNASSEGETNQLDESF